MKLVCVSGGNPYSNPHLLRPALFPPSDGYHPPEDPLAGVARQLEAAAKLRAAVPGLAVVGSGYTYLQEWLPKVGQAVVRGGGADFVGLGRVVLSYPELPADVLAGRPLQFKKLCRTFSDCTHRPAERPGIGVLPARPVLQGPPRGEGTGGGEAGVKWPTKFAAPTPAAGGYPDQGASGGRGRGSGATDRGGRAVRGGAAHAPGGVAAAPAGAGGAGRRPRRHREGAGGFTPRWSGSTARVHACTPTPCGCSPRPTNWPPTPAPSSPRRNDD